MADPEIHVIITLATPYGVMVQSPQLPELVGGRATSQELDRDLIDILRFAGAPEEYRLIRHAQQHLEAADGREYAVRWRLGDLSEVERATTVDRLNRAMTLADQRDVLLGNEVGASGVPVFAATVPSDPLAQIFGQMYDRRDAISAVLAVDEQQIWSTQFVSSDDAPDGWKTVSEAGFDATSPISALMKKFGGDVLPGGLASRQRTLVVA